MIKMFSIRGKTRDFFPDLNPSHVPFKKVNNNKLIQNKQNHTIYSIVNK